MGLGRCEEESRVGKKLLVGSGHSDVSLSTSWAPSAASSAGKSSSTTMVFVGLSPPFLALVRDHRKRLLFILWHMRNGHVHLWDG